MDCFYFLLEGILDVACNEWMLGKLENTVK